MYQPYPAAEPPGEPERIEPPGPVRAAVKLMYAGGLSAITVIVWWWTVGSLGHPREVPGVHPGAAA